MKLATFTHLDDTRIGIVTGDEVVDLAAAAPTLPRDMLSFLEAGSEAMEAAHAAIESGARLFGSPSTTSSNDAIPAASFKPSQAPAVSAAMELGCRSDSSSAGTLPSVFGVSVSGSINLEIIAAAGTESTDAEIRCPAICGNESRRKST